MKYFFVLWLCIIIWADILLYNNGMPLSIILVKDGHRFVLSAFIGYICASLYWFLFDELQILGRAGRGVVGKGIVTLFGILSYFFLVETGKWLALNGL